MSTAASLSVLSSPGGRRCARRCIVSALLGALLLASTAVVPGAAVAPPSVTVRQVDNAYQVNARFEVAVDTAAVFAVLTDYERIPRITPDVTRSVVQARTVDRVIVEQEAVSRVLFFSKTVHLRLEVQREADTLRFRDVCGRSFTVYEGRWQVTANGAGSVVSYELRAQPAFDVPRFLVKRLLKRDAAAMIERLRHAMIESSGAA